MLSAKVPHIVVDRIDNTNPPPSQRTIYYWSFVDRFKSWNTWIAQFDINRTNDAICRSCHYQWSRWHLIPTFCVSHIHNTGWLAICYPGSKSKILRKTWCLWTLFIQSVQNIHRGNVLVMPTPAPKMFIMLHIYTHPLVFIWYAAYYPDVSYQTIRDQWLSKELGTSVKKAFKGTNKEHVYVLSSLLQKIPTSGSGCCTVRDHFSVLNSRPQPDNAEQLLLLMMCKE